MAIIAHNMLAMNAKRQLNISTGNKAKASEHLASGYRINRAADNAAGLAISEKMRGQIRGLEKAANNVVDGKSLICVADGALAEVHSILDRMKELSVQAANDVNTDNDRLVIQAEIDQLLVEIDRIGSDTEFNTRKIFQGGECSILNANGQPVSLDSIPFGDFQLARADLQNYPFNTNSRGNYLKLAASTSSNYSAMTWNLIYGNGSTSNSNIRIKYKDDNNNDVFESMKISEMPITNCIVQNSGANCTRTFKYDAGNGVEFEIKQTVTVEANNGNEQYYKIDWDVKNTGQRDADVELMDNVDTAYNNNDRCEQYYINSTKIDSFRMYSDKTQYKNQSSDVYARASMGSDSISIIDADNALPFSEKIKWESSSSPNSVSIGNWGSRTGDWEYYDNLATNLGGSTNNSDIAVSLMWDRQVSQGTTTSISFKHGIAKASNDSNLTGVTLKPQTGSNVHTDHLDLWIQSGANARNGMYVTIGEMNSGTLGIRGLDMTTNRNATNANAAVDNAIKKVSTQRSALGAQNNRLEYAESVDDNTAENIQSAESRIRDADIADEMLDYSKHNILEQAGQAMLAQANQNTQGILTLLR